MDAIIAHGLDPRPEFRQSLQTYDIYKDPATDDGTKTSLKGFQFVYKIGDEIVCQSGVDESRAFSPQNLLKTIYRDGQFYNQTTIEKIRENVENYLKYETKSL